MAGRRLRSALLLLEAGIRLLLLLEHGKREPRTESWRRGRYANIVASARGSLRCSLAGILAALVVVVLPLAASVGRASTAAAAAAATPVRIVGRSRPLVATGVGREPLADGCASRSR